MNPLLDIISILIMPYKKVFYRKVVFALHLISCKNLMKRHIDLFRTKTIPFDNTLCIEKNFNARRIMIDFFFKEIQYL